MTQSEKDKAIAQAYNICSYVDKITMGAPDLMRISSFNLTVITQSAKMWLDNYGHLVKKRRLEVDE